MADDDTASADAAPASDATPVIPAPADVPTPAAVADADDPTGYVVWHRKHLRTDDHLALARAVADGDVVCPLFVFDPTFYGGDGIACDARIRFLHQAVTSLDRLYAATPGAVVERPTPRSDDRIAAETPLSPGSTAPSDDALRTADAPGLTVGYGDPVAVLSAFVDRGWSVLTMATPTSRYGKRRDDSVRQACGDAVEFVSGDGLVRDREWSRTNWQSRVQRWLDADQHTPQLGNAVRLVVDTGVTPALVDDAFGIEPAKRKVPTGTHRVATTRLRSFADRIREYPRNISAPGDAREGTSGLSPFLNFGLLSVRQVHQHVTDTASACRGREMFTSRLVWNMHYNQKLADWPGWTERAVNPVYEDRNEDSHDPDLVTAWKRGETGFPMVDASMRCLRETGWLNFRMRAMCASVFTHIFRQPWWIGADWYHHHLIDSDVGINYTQWQSQAGLVGKPSQRVYNPRKQVRDHDPDGAWITEYVPELAGLPGRFLDRPERTPLAVQADCGVIVGEDYPRPVVDFEARREAFWTRHERRRAAAARALARPEVAKRASFSGGYDAAVAIAEEYGHGDDLADGRQVSLSDVDAADPDPAHPQAADGDADGSDDRHPRPPGTTGSAGDGSPALPTGAGREAGDPSPDDRSAVAEALRASDTDTKGSDGGDTDDETSTEQATMGEFDRGRGG
jgi:deoxyribodipyrimidine photo-lyase